MCYEIIVSMLVKKNQSEALYCFFWGVFASLFQIGQQRLLGNEPGEMEYIWDQETTESTLEPAPPRELSGS